MLLLDVVLYAVLLWYLDQVRMRLRLWANVHLGLHHMTSNKCSLPLSPSPSPGMPCPVLHSMNLNPAPLFYLMPAGDAL